ncbi:MAG: hypothetical protein NVS3B24_24310 [Candidatus Dormibacteria bacterium]
MTDPLEPTVNPYHGWREQWSLSLLNEAGQRQTIAFVGRVVRDTPNRDQKTYPDVAHNELCGYVAMACCAYAVGLINDVDAGIAELLADARSIGLDPARGAWLSWLTTLAARRGWPVETLWEQAGDLDVSLALAGRVGITLLNTAYGLGAQWDDLHPAVGGPIGHWEAIGALSGPVAAPPAPAPTTITEDDAMHLEIDHPTIPFRKDWPTIRVSDFAAGHGWREPDGSLHHELCGNGKLVKVHAFFWGDAAGNQLVYAGEGPDGLNHATTGDRAKGFPEEWTQY